MKHAKTNMRAKWLYHMNKEQFDTKACEVQTMHACQMCEQ